eukprot:scaffold1447_cov115-Isochrysis_galbana.AAC.1
MEAMAPAVYRPTPLSPISPSTVRGICPPCLSTTCRAAACSIAARRPRRAPRRSGKPPSTPASTGPPPVRQGHAKWVGARRYHERAQRGVEAVRPSASPQQQRARHAPPRASVGT